MIHDDGVNIQRGARRFAPHLVRAVTEHGGAHDAAPRVHTVLVAAEGVDLSVVAHHPDGLGALPTATSGKCL